MLSRQDPAIRSGLCLQAQGSDTIGKVAYAIDVSDFIPGGLRKHFSFLYDAEKRIFFDYFNVEPLLTQGIAPDQKLYFNHNVPHSTPRPKEGRYDTLGMQLRESMEIRVQDAYSFYILSEFVKPALQQALDHQSLVMIASGGEISFPIIVKKGKENSLSPDDTIAVCTNFRDATGKSVRRLEICQKSLEAPLRDIYTSLQTRFGYRVEITR